LPNVIVEGRCDSRFTDIKDVFAASWRDFAEVGAALAITLDGKSVVDLRAGWADSRPRATDTVVLVASVSKAPLWKPGSAHSYHLHTMGRASA
jgi:CubicO group peptidase (beta-lactamase class C family)